MPTNDPYGFANYFADATAPRAAPYDQGQLDWISAINGQTPDQYLATQQAWQRNGNQAPPTAYDQWWTQQTDPNGSGVGRATWDAQQNGQQQIDNLNSWTDTANQQQGWIANQLADNSARSQQSADWLGQTNAGLGQRANASTNWANGQDSNALGAWQQGQAPIKAWDQGNIGAFSQAANAPMQMNASAYVGDARSNAADVARQTQVFNQLQGAANGSLDQTSQAAQAYANAQDVANQQRAAQTLQNAGNGSLDVNLANVRELDKLRDPDSIGGMRDLYAASKGSKDVHVGQEDPAAYQAAVDTRNKLWGLTDPTVTAQEKLMFEIQRQQQEQDEGATRAALQTDAQRRGVSGIGTEIARSALGAQQTSRNRMLQDMQALAQAQARSQDALAAHGTLSTNMTAQANQIALQNAGNQLGALGQYTDVHANSANLLGQMGAANATNNSNRRLNAQQAASQAYAELRAQGFDEAYARGKAADIMATANADRQLGAMNSSAQLSSSMRQSGDAMNMFNQGQRQQQIQFSDNYTAGRQDAQFDRQDRLFQNNNTIGNNMRTDNNSAFDASTFVTGRTDTRNQAQVQTERGLNTDWINQNNVASNTQASSLGAQSGIVQTQLGNNQSRAGANLNWGTQKTNDAIRLQGIGQENEAYKQGLASIQSPSGGQSGGIRHVPPDENYDPYYDPYGPGYNPNWQPA